MSSSDMAISRKAGSIGITTLNPVNHGGHRGRGGFHRRREAGSEILEAAFVLPILFLVVFAIFWFGMAYYVMSTAQRAAKQAIAAAARPTCATCGNDFSSRRQVVNTIQTALQTGHLSTSKIASTSLPFACQPTPAPSCNTSQGVEFCDGVPLTCGAAACQNPPAACGANPALGMRVSFGYRLDSPVPLGSWSSITIPASAQSPAER